MLNIIIAMLAYASYQVLSSFAAPRMSNLWFTVGGVLITAVLSALIAGTQLFSGRSLGTIEPVGAVMLGVANGAIIIFVFFFSRSLQQFSPGLVIPVAFGGAILCSTIATFVLKSQIPSLAQFAGLLLVSGGLLVLGLAHR